MQQSLTIGSMLIDDGANQDVHEDECIPDLIEWFAAMSYCLDRIGTPYVESRPRMVQALRPKSTLKAQG